VKTNPRTNRISPHGFGSATWSTDTWSPGKNQHTQNDAPYIALVEHVFSKRPQDVSATLHEAFFNWDVQVVWLLLENGADVNTRGGMDRTPLHSASIQGYPDVVRWLLRRDVVDVNAQQFDRSTALHFAAFHGHLEVAEILLEHNAEVNASDDRGRLPLHDAARSGRLELVRLLLMQGGDANARDSFGSTPLDMAKAGKDTEIVKPLSEHLKE
jgi:ankyrin repeat protein